MRAGRLDRRITIQRKTVTQSSSGAEVETWSNLVHRWPASYSAIRGDERRIPTQNVATEQVEFRIRWAEVVADLSPLDRVLYPCDDDANPPARAIWDILAVPEIGRREGLSIIATRTPDVPT